MEKNVRILLLVLGFSLSGCNDFLDVEPQNRIEKDSFWQSEEDVLLAVAGVYDDMRGGLDEYFLWGELRADLIVPTNRGDNTARIQLSNGLFTPSNGLTSWIDIYSAINRANIVLENMELVRTPDPSFTSDIEAQYRAEMLFVRSLELFYIARTFGNAPLTITSFESDEADFFLGKSTQAEIFAQIIRDLEDAENNIPLEYSSPELTKGRGTLWALKALLADVYLWNGDYQQALDKANEIITSGEFALRGRNLWFELFSDGNTEESIFELQYSGIRSQLNSLPQLSTSFNVLGQNGRTQITEKLLGIFDDNDLRGEGGTFITEQFSLWKYIGDGYRNNENALNTRTFRDANWIFYRLADAYFMQAEAAIELNDFETAGEAINRIRARAGISVIDFTGFAKSDMLRLLLDEKAREFAGEGKRWYDLVRVASKNNFEFKDILIENVLSSRPPDLKVLLESQLNDPGFWYLPISQGELDRNANLEQNEYYDNLFN